MREGGETGAPEDVFRRRHGLAGRETVCVRGTRIVDILGRRIHWKTDR